jgi:hypothetical protein
MMALHTDLLPHLGQRRQAVIVLGLDQERRHIDAEIPQQVGQDTDGRRKEAEHHAAHHDPGNEMRQIAHRLHDALEAGVGNFGQHDRKQNGDGKVERQLQYADAQRVLKQRCELAVGEELQHVFAADPRIGKNAGEAVAQVKIPESHLDAQDGDDIEYDQVRKPQPHEHVQHRPAADIPQDQVARGFSRPGFDHRSCLLSALLATGPLGIRHIAIGCSFQFQKPAPRAAQTVSKPIR